MMVMFLLTFVSNIFVDPKTMPGWSRRSSVYNLITHLATVVRGLMHGSVPAGKSAGCSSRQYFVAVFGPITMVLYRNKKCRCRSREHLVEINSDNLAHSANAITGTRPGHDKESRMSTIPKNNSKPLRTRPAASSIGVPILQVAGVAIIAAWWNLEKLAG